MFYETVKKWRAGNIEEDRQEGLRESIRRLNSNGIPQNEIARLLEVDIPFVRKSLRIKKEVAIAI
jgi:hypothetical protein